MRAQPKKKTVHASTTEEETSAREFAVFYESDQQLYKYELNNTDSGVDHFRKNEHLPG